MKNYKRLKNIEYFKRNYQHNSNGARKRLAGNPLSEEALMERRALIPTEDTRDLTSRWLGDPIPGDPRRKI